MQYNNTDSTCSPLKRLLERNGWRCASIKRGQRVIASRNCVNQSNCRNRTTSAPPLCGHCHHPPCRACQGFAMCNSSQPGSLSKQQQSQSALTEPSQPRSRRPRSRRRPRWYCRPGMAYTAPGCAPHCTFLAHTAPATGPQGCRSCPSQASPCTLLRTCNRCHQAGFHR